MCACAHACRHIHTLMRTQSQAYALAPGYLQNVLTCLGPHGFHKKMPTDMLGCCYNENSVGSCHCCYNRRTVLCPWQSCQILGLQPETPILEDHLWLCRKVAQSLDTCHFHCLPQPLLPFNTAASIFFSFSFLLFIYLRGGGQPLMCSCGPSCERQVQELQAKQRYGDTAWKRNFTRTSRY